MNFHLVLFASLMAFCASTLAAETLVKLDARCPDKTIEYDITKHALAELQIQKGHKVVADNTAEIIIRLSASPVRSRTDDKGPPLGIALATLVQKRSATGIWEVKRFSSAYVPLDDIQTTVRSVLSDALK
jgi:hypothetical protein